MKSKSFSFRTIIFCMSLWELSRSAELDYTPTVLLKPILLFNKAIVASILSRPDYVCRMSPQGKDKLCELVFNQKDLKARFKVQYDGKSEKNDFESHCEVKTFNCILNTLFNLGLSQEMLVCFVTSSESGNRVDKYFVSTNYTSDKVILFEAGDDDRVSAVAAVYDLNLDKLNEENRIMETERN